MCALVRDYIIPFADAPPPGTSTEPAGTTRIAMCDAHGRRSGVELELYMHSNAYKAVFSHFLSLPSIGVVLAKRGNPLVRGCLALHSKPASYLDNRCCCSAPLGYYYFAYRWISFNSPWLWTVVFFLLLGSD